jgi:hypothetical protein
MANTFELIGGWIVAGLVTAAGVLLAHRQSERSRERQEDRVMIYEPLHREMEAAMARGRALLPLGYRAWSPSSDFTDLINRGALVPKRHDVLRAGVSELLHLQEKLESTFKALYDKREKAIQERWAETDLEDEKGGRMKLAKLLGYNFSDDHFNEALTRLDKEWWTQELNVRVTGQGGNLGFKLRLLTSAEDLFDEITALLEVDRKAFFYDGEALLRQVERIKACLEDAIREGRVYRTHTGRESTGERNP